jgi:hypothetical protein
VGGRGFGLGVEKPKARKMPVSRDESHQSAARFVRRFRVAPDFLPLNQSRNLLDNILQRTQSLATPNLTSQKTRQPKRRKNCLAETKLFVRLADRAKATTCRNLDFTN